MAGPAHRLSALVGASLGFFISPRAALAADAADPLQLAMFLDAYAAWQSAAPGTLATLSGHRAFSGQGSNLRAENGISLAFLGFDAKYDGGGFGAVANVRFGQAASIYHHQAEGESDLTFGVDHLTQAYLFLDPAKELELDLGMFTSPFGVESLESWKNPNYTISALYVYGQPSWHTGLKAKWQLAEGLGLMGLVCNGVNNVSEAQVNGGLDQVPTLGGSLTYEPDADLSFALGGLAAIDRDHNEARGFDRFVDFVSTYKIGALTISLNMDFISTRHGAPNGHDRFFWGGSLTSSYRFSESVGIAARGEYLHDDADYGGGSVWKLVTGTLTLDVEPVPHVRNVIVRWENRWERSNQPIYGKDSRGTADTTDDLYSKAWFESVLGVVVTTAP
jgi:hypothetical protein